MFCIENNIKILHTEIMQHKCNKNVDPRIWSPHESRPQRNACQMPSKLVRSGPAIYIGMH